MVVFPNAKINLGLQVLRKRSDGFHDLETIFFPLYKARDVLEVVSQNPSAGTDIVFTTTGLPIEGEENNNLCVRAYRLLKNDYPQMPPVNIHLHKAIPMGAGLGGGSADGAFTLSILNRQYNLGISHQELLVYALQLGSDCPFFLVNTPCFATGRGEQLEPIKIEMSNKTIVIISPNIHINTGLAFSKLKLTPTLPSLRELINKPIDTWKNSLKNDFEEAVFFEHPRLAEIKKNLYDAGAIYAAMTGTGSSIFGIFTQSPRQADLAGDYGLMIL